MPSKLREGLRTREQRKQSKLNKVKREWRETSHRCFQLREKEMMLDRSLRKVEELRRREEKKKYELALLIGREKGKDCPARMKRRTRRDKDYGTFCLLREASLSNTMTNFYAYYCRECRLRNKNLEIKILVRKLKGSKD